VSCWRGRSPSTRCWMPGTKSARPRWPIGRPGRRWSGSRSPPADQRLGAYLADEARGTRAGRVDRGHSRMSNAGANLKHPRQPREVPKSSFSLFRGHPGSPSGWSSHPCEATADEVPNFRYNPPWSRHSFSPYRCNASPDLQGIETRLCGLRVRDRWRCNASPDLQGIETVRVLGCSIGAWRCNASPDLQGIET
jgi:hypothetical protein